MRDIQIINSNELVVMMVLSELEAISNIIINYFLLPVFCLLVGLLFFFFNVNIPAAVCTHILIQINLFSGFLHSAPKIPPT